MLPNEDEDNFYLKQEVLNASPLKLRWMLIDKAESLCGQVRQLWNAGEDLQASGWLLRIREILGELLEGVTNRDNPVSQNVADFYVFMLQLVTRIEQTKDTEKLQTLEELLHIENETWRQVIQKSLAESAKASGLAFPQINTASLDQATDYSGLNLEL